MPTSEKCLFWQWKEKQKEFFDKTLTWILISRSIIVMFSVVWVVIELPSSPSLFSSSSTLQRTMDVEKMWRNRSEKVFLSSDCSECERKERERSWKVLTFPRAPSSLRGGKLRNFRLSEYPLKISEGKRFFLREIAEKINKVKKGKNWEKMPEVD